MYNPFPEYIKIRYKASLGNNDKLSKAKNLPSTVWFKQTRGILGGNDEACKLIQKGALEWVRKSHLDKPRRTEGGIWNDTLTINMR
jgi:hypothetical protein